MAINFNKLKKPENKNILAGESVPAQNKKKLTVMLSSMVTPEEKQKIIELAHENGLKVSTFLRHILKKHGYL